MPSIFRDYFERLQDFQRKFGVDTPPDPITTGWQIARSGNLYKQYRHLTLTVFHKKKRGGFCLCIAGPRKWGRRFIDLGAGNLDDALREAQYATDSVIKSDAAIATHVRRVEKGVR